MAQPVTSQEQREYARRTETRERGLISALYHEKRLLETGYGSGQLRVAELRMRRAQVMNIRGQRAAKACLQAYRRGGQGMFTNIQPRGHVYKHTLS